MQVCTYLRVRGVPITNKIMLATQQERGSDPDIPNASFQSHEFIKYPIPEMQKQSIPNPDKGFPRIPGLKSADPGVPKKVRPPLTVMIFFI